MKILPLVCGWLVIASSAFGSTADEIRKFNDAYALSERQAVTAYPDTTNAESRIVKRMAALDKAFEKDGNPIFNSPDKPMILAKMAAKELGIAAVIQTPDDIAYQRSEELAVAAYPDTTNAESAIIKRMSAMDRDFEKSGNPIFKSPNKPMILATMAAKELGIAAVGEKPVPPATSTEKPDSEVIPVLLVSRGGPFRSVTIRRVEPDGLRIIHEYGVAKIPIEDLSDEQRSQYGLTMARAQIYRQRVASATAEYYASQQEAARQAQADADAAATAAAVAERERQEQIRANPPVVVQAPVWQRYVTNSDFRAHNRNNISDEIRRQDGDNAADQFVTNERLKDLEKAKDALEQQAEEARMKAARIPLTHTIDGGLYQRRGDRITINGDASTGYTIKGDKLYDVSTGSPSHTRSGSMWIPLDSSHSQIHDSGH